jgi:outer membrane protein assembly factor BamB
MSCTLHAQSIKSIDDFDKLPSLLWSYKTKAPFFGSPIIADGVVYAGGLDSTLYAWDLASGKIVWKFKTKGAIRSTPSIVNDILYLNGGDGSLYAIFKKSGKEKWRFTTEGEKKYDFADYYHSSPVIADQVLYFGSGDGHAYALHVDNGKLKWKFKTEGVVHTTPALSHHKIFFGSFDGYLYALDVSQGTLVWKFKSVGQRFFPRGEMMGSPVVYNQLVFIGSRDYNLYAIDQEKGYCHWNKSFPRGWALANVIQDSVLYTGTSDDRLLIAYDPASGVEKWRSPVKFNVFGIPAFSKSMVYATTIMGKMSGIDRKTGQIKWTFTTEGYNKRHLDYFKPDDSYRDDIASIVKSNEALVDVEYLLGGFFSTPALYEDKFIVTSTDGTLYCFKRN